MIYVASPYSDPNPARMEERYAVTRAHVAKLANLGFFAYSPIVYFHPLATLYTMPKDAEFWWPFNQEMLVKSESLTVLCLPGWDKSVGVAREIEWWKSYGEGEVHYTPDPS